jgi:hypothetical protein
MDFEFETTRTALANAFAAAGAELLNYMGASATQAAIPDTQPQKYAIAGTLPGILQMAGKMMGEEGNIADLTEFTQRSIRDHADFCEDVERLSTADSRTRKLLRKEIYDSIDARVRNAVKAALASVTPPAAAEKPTGDLTDEQIDDMAFGYCPSGKIGELRELCRSIARAAIAAHLAQQPAAAQTQSVVSVVSSIDRGEDDEGLETPGIYTREEVLDMLKYEIVTDSGARTLLNGDGMEFTLHDLALLANRAAHLARQSQQAERDEAASVDLHNAIMNLPCKRTMSHFAGRDEMLAYKEGHRDARHAAAELAIAPASQEGAHAAQWISVDERLPEYGQSVLALYWPYKNRANPQAVTSAEYIDGQFFLNDGEQMHYPSHWMPLPPAPALQTPASAERSGDHG